MKACLVTHFVFLLLASSSLLGCKERVIVVEGVSPCEERMEQILKRFAGILGHSGSELIVMPSDEIEQLVIRSLARSPWVVEDPVSGKLHALDSWKTDIRIGVMESAENYLVVVRSAGPDRKFSSVGAKSDDDIIMAKDCFVWVDNQ